MKMTREQRVKPLSAQWQSRCPSAVSLTGFHKVRQAFVICWLRPLQKGPCSGDVVYWWLCSGEISKSRILKVSCWTKSRRESPFFFYHACLLTLHHRSCSEVHPSFPFSQLATSTCRLWHNSMHLLHMWTVALVHLTTCEPLPLSSLLSFVFP